MLVGLSVRDVILIEHLDLAFQDGLCVLTGETGAGKSILLDALGLALGNRADSGLLRPGAEQARVTASFEVGAGHQALAMLAELDLAPEEGAVVLRRTLGRDGRSRAFINDQPVSVGLLRRVGDALIEVQGQFENRGLLDPASHRALLDAYGHLSGQADEVAALWRNWRDARQAHQDAMDEAATAAQEEDFLRHTVDELQALDPRPGEEQALAEERGLLINAGRIVEALTGALAALAGEESNGGAESALATAARRLDRIAAQAGARLEPTLAALNRASAETAETVAQLQSLMADIELDAGRVEQVNARYFALHELARKHNVAVDDLASLKATLEGRLDSIVDADARLARLAGAADEARTAYVQAADALSDARRKAAGKLDAAVMRELPPLKLEKARFRTRLDPLDEAQWGAAGIERVSFEVSTNPGSPGGPLAKIASGGELARFLLAIKVVLAEVGPPRTLIFDEVDAGIGGATAHAVGERLARLTRDRQVLVVTHSPQVGARGRHHWRVHKEPHGDRVATRVSRLDPDERQEEIARMLSGAEVTDEARAAARSLIQADAP